MQFTFLDKSFHVGVCANIFSSEADEKGINNRRMVPSCLKPVLIEAVAATLLMFCEMFCGQRNFTQLSIVRVLHLRRTVLIVEV